MTKTYNGCPKKLEARYETIIKNYRKYFGFKLPKDKQYLTMCATHADENQNILEGTELDQILEENLIDKNQFYGIDIDENIIINNQKAIPEGNWHHGDFYQTLTNLNLKGKLNPGIVNCDYLKMPKDGVSYLARALAFLSDFDNVMFVGNLILRTRHHYCSEQKMIEYLDECSQFHYALESGWRLVDETYTYNGTGKNCTWLGSIVLVKKNKSYYLIKL